MMMGQVLNNRRTYLCIAPQGPKGRPGRCPGTPRSSPREPPNALNTISGSKKRHKHANGEPPNESGQSVAAFLSDLETQKGSPRDPQEHPKGAKDSQHALRAIFGSNTWNVQACPKRGPTGSWGIHSGCPLVLPRWFWPPKTTILR